MYATQGSLRFASLEILSPPSLEISISPDPGPVGPRQYWEEGARQKEGSVFWEAFVVSPRGTKPKPTVLQARTEWFLYVQTSPAWAWGLRGVTWNIFMISECFSKRKDTANKYTCCTHGKFNFFFYLTILVNKGTQGHTYLYLPVSQCRSRRARLSDWNLFIAATSTLHKWLFILQSACFTTRTF